MSAAKNIEKNALLRWIDKISNICSSIGVYMIIFVAVVLTYEAIARYVFHAPTRWTQDVSTIMQIWLTYLGMAYVLRDGSMIRITAVLAVAPRWLVFILELLALLIILSFSILAVYKGLEMMQDSIRLGRRQPTMLALPNWISELAIIIGFGLLILQTLAEIVRLPFRGPPSFSIDGEVVIAQDEKNSITTSQEQS